MTRLDAATDEWDLTADACDGPRELLLEPREVPLGGVRAMAVHRSLPQRDLPTVGAWCFFDRFGPQEALMRVEPHPHIGLQTVTWPLVGEVRHRDSIDSDVTISRGVLNIMTSGRGISHSEYSVGDDPIPLDALQLWIALPESRRHGGPDFERHADLPTLRLPALEGADADATVVVGELGDVVSPATVYTPIVGAEVVLAPGSRVRIPFRRDWEYAIAAVEGDLVAHAGRAGEPTALGALDLLYLGVNRDGIEVSTIGGAMFFLLGGEPFADDLVMWWNFVGRDHDEIVEAREEWEAGSERFGHVVTHGDERIPAPPMPQVRLTPRRRKV
ncbi:pirin [Microbacterium sp. Root53]|uniref:pirin family protein n=1 Tax=Microbacterium sp. Root53 TaxID=1736553 RepID=UPI0006F57CF7|nr:pirin family protein [Microbacterium sp. Root53]KQZ11991.1 pirin [Microbacterium sp. Root53]